MSTPKPFTAESAKNTKARWALSAPFAIPTVNRLK